MDKLLAKLSEQQAVLSQQNEVLRGREDDSLSSKGQDQTSSTNSLPITPANDGVPTTAPTTRPASANLGDKNEDDEQVLRLKLQLSQAQNHITKLDNELAQSRTARPEAVPGIPGAPHVPFHNRALGHESVWTGATDVQDTGEPLHANNLNRNRTIWGAPRATFSHTPLQAPVAEAAPTVPWIGGRGFTQNYTGSNPPFHAVDGASSDRLTSDSHMFMRPSGGRRSARFEARISSPHQCGSTYGGYSAPDANYDTMMSPSMTGTAMSSGLVSPQNIGPLPMGMFQPNQPIGTQLSPYASEFTSKTAWKNEVAIYGPSHALIPVLTADRGPSPTAQRTFRQQNRSTTVDFLTEMSIAIGST